MVRKRYKCFCCKEWIESVEDVDMIQEKTGEDGKIKNKRFHKSKQCHQSYIKGQKEFKEFCELNEYIKFEFMNYTVGMNLSSYARTKLQGLRTGKVRISKGEKVTCDGYPYNVILSTMKLKKNEILKGIQGKTFNNENHKFDYMMVIVSNSLNDVYKRYLNKERQSNNIQTVNIEMHNRKDEYIEIKANKQQNKVASLLKDMI